MADGLTVSVERVEAVGAEAILLHLLLTDGEHEEHRTCTVLPEIYAAQSFSVGPISFVSKKTAFEDAESSFT